MLHCSGRERHLILTALATTHMLHDEWSDGSLPTSDLMDIDTMLEGLASDTVELKMYIDAAQRRIPRKHPTSDS